MVIFITVVTDDASGAVSYDHASAKVCWGSSGVDLIPVSAVPYRANNIPNRVAAGGVSSCGKTRQDTLRDRSQNGIKPAISERY